MKSWKIGAVLAACFCSQFSIAQTPAVSNAVNVSSALPLHTSGQWIVDRNGNRLKLNSVAWYGAEEQDYVVAGLERQDIHVIAQRIHSLGFNSVRLPWSNQLYESNPVVPNSAVEANPQFLGKHAMEVFDATVDALTQEGILIVLDNHMSNADWCCSGTDGNTLWYNTDYPESKWIADWQAMVRRYKNVPQVIGADLRNEPRGDATWGGNAATDWHAAAERGGNAVLRINPNLLIFVEGINYAADLTGVAQLPVQLNLPNRLVYSAHDYSFYHNGVQTEGALFQALDQSWGYVATPGQTYTAPIWIGEWGNCHDSQTCMVDSTPGTGGFWFQSFRDYLDQRDFDWSYWALNGTEAKGTSRTFGYEETYGVLDPYWNAPALPSALNPTPTANLVGQLQTIMDATQGPGVPSSYRPRILLTSPVPGTLIASGATVTISADAFVRSGAVSAVDFYANGSLIGSTNTSPYMFVWQNVPAGTYQITAQAASQTGIQAGSTGPDSLIAFAYGTPAASSSIAINFGDYNVTPMASSEMAGVIAQQYWNGAYGNSGVFSGVLDSHGGATAAEVNWAASNMYYTNILDQPGNFRMMKGYLDNSNTSFTAVQVTGIPGTYDVYVYFDGGNGSITRSASYRLLASGKGHGCAASNAVIVSGTDAANTDFSGTFTFATAGSAGNYVVFPDCTGENFTILAIHGTSTDGTYRGPVNGIQIVSH
ncbi:MAG TPA: cellulase family glycosylhydrolase [Bryobacteraceae bacterium]|jgi:endoglucanase|nr:cellulase family glycosylhydrolase [Bryobacteraceae bacterium]